MAGAIFMTAALTVIVGITAYLVGTLVKSIQNEKKTRMRLWKNFGLSLGFCILFFVSWLAHEGWALKDESATEPEGYYDKQEEAIAAGRELARNQGVKLYVHGQDGLVREESGSSS